MFTNRIYKYWFYLTIALGGTFYHEIWLLRIIYVPYLINKTTDVLERVSEFIYLHSNIGYNELKSHILKKIWESLATLATLIWLLSGVCTLKITLPWESLATLAAYIWSFTSVCHQMGCKMTTRRELHVTWRRNMYHLRLHIGEKPFQCIQCCMIFIEINVA